MVPYFRGGWIGADGRGDQADDEAIGEAVRASDAVEQRIDAGQPGMLGQC